MHRATLRESLPLWRRALRRRRRLLLILAVLTAAVIVLPSFAPASARTVPVLVAARDLPSGVPLAASDLEVSQVAQGLVPAGALADPREAIGQAVGSPVPRGQPVTAALLQREGGLEPGRAAVVVPADRALLPHLRIGSEVDVVISTPEPALTRTVRARVLSLGESAGGRAAEAVSGGSASEGTVPVVLSVELSDTAAIAYATREGWVLLACVG